MKYSEVIENLANKLAEVFGEVYHSVEIIETDGAKLPSIVNGNDWITLEPSDQKETVYMRRNGDDSVLEELKIGSCVKAYRMSTGLRIVYFNDSVFEHNKIISDVLRSVLVQGIKLNRVVMDKARLYKDESSGAYVFGPATLYFAVDVNVYWELKPDNCDQDFCVVLDNPIKNCS